MLVSSSELFKKAQKENFAVPAPNFIDLDSARSYIEVATEKNLPIILAFAEAHTALLPLEEAALIGKYFANKVPVPVVLHLDHGMNKDFIKQAISLGFTSVMIDASSDPFEKNVEKTKEIVDYAHARNIVVEAEIGHVGSGENYENHDLTDSIYTEVKDAVAFVEQTRVDSLAVSIGTAHGAYKGRPKLSFERLNEIRNSLDIPLVLHGGSSTGDQNLNKCAREGITKINIFTDLMNGGFEEIIKNKPNDYFALKKYSNEGMKKILSHYYEVFGTK